MDATRRWGNRARGLAAVATAFGAVLLSVSPACADEPKPPEEDTNPNLYPPPSTGPRLVLTGALLTAGWYGGAVGMSYLWPDSDGAKDLRIPVAGPFMSLGKTGCGDQETGCTTFTIVIRTILTTFAGVGQAGGILAMVEGFAMPTGPRKVSKPPPPKLKRSLVRVAPVVSASHGVTVGLTGQF